MLTFHKHANNRATYNHVRTKLEYIENTSRQMQSTTSLRRRLRRKTKAPEVTTSYYNSSFICMQFSTCRRYQLSRVPISAAISPKPGPHGVGQPVLRTLQHRACCDTVLTRTSCGVIVLNVVLAMQTRSNHRHLTCCYHQYSTSKTTTALHLLLQKILKQVRQLIYTRQLLAAATATLIATVVLLVLLYMVL